MAVRGIIVRVDGTSEDVDVPLVTGYEDGYAETSIDRAAIADAIGAGLAEHVPVVWPTEGISGIGMFVDSQGRVVGKPPNPMARNVVAALASAAESEATSLAGDVMFLGWGADDDVALTDGQAASINTAIEQLANIQAAPHTGRRAGRVPLLTYSQARGMAESMWGSGGTTAHHTNRTGAFYFSCSGHGGFVIDDRALAERERELLTEAGFTADRCRGVRDASGRIMAIRHPHSQVARPRQLTYRPGLGESVDGEIPVWTLEEDTEWAAAYALTGIRTPDAFRLTEDQLITYARESLARWHPIAAEVAGRLADHAREAGPGEGGGAPAPPDAGEALEAADPRCELEL